MTKPQILVLFCGGTIVMQTGPDGALIPQTKGLALATLKQLEPKLAGIADVAYVYVDNIDSANITPEHWDTITRVIMELYNSYDGFVITHGTNTLAYTASALTWTLQNIGKPVVMTGAQIPGYRIDSDARRNFINAVRVATMDVSGVYIVFDEEIILGCRSSKVSESKLNGFETINWDLAGEIRIDVRLSDDVKHRNHDASPQFKSGFDERIMTVTLVPGTPVFTLNSLLSSGAKGIILRGYGPGDIAYDYVSFLVEARNKKIPVVVTTQCIEGATLMHINDVGKKALEAGVIQAYDMSIESVTTKLMWALAHYPYEEIAKIMTTDLAGELNKEGKIY